MSKPRLCELYHLGVLFGDGALLFWPDAFLRHDFTGTLSSLWGWFPGTTLSLPLCPAISIQFTKEPKSQDALHGRSAMLRCEVGNPANITYEWYKDDERLENTERRFQEGSNLKFISVDRQLDAGSFYCKALNYGTGEMLTSTEASFNIKCE
uniref:Ig-like domain-containing protein n=1 Tax=Fundulus heteroclitus TaxID=8078 RepID=A0A3Q2NQI0_FUNHE